jgi:amino acid adenylation domain-containing protein
MSDSLNNLEQRIAELSPAKRELLREAAARKRARQRIEPRPRPERIPLTLGQRRLWVLDQLTPGLAAYNTPYGLWMEGALDRAALRRSLQILVDRHESLRTVFRAHDGEPFQVVREIPEAKLDWRERQATGTTPEERRNAALSTAREETARPFDLAADLLLRSLLIEVAPESFLLVLTFHHIGIDGWSIASLMAELQAAYDAFRSGAAPSLPPPELQIADVALWQQETFGGEGLRAQLDYWKERLQGAATTLDLPADRARPAVQSFRGTLVRSEVPVELYARLERLAREQQATLSTVFLAAFQALLSRLTGQEDLAVAMGVAGRSRPELEPVVGFFVNTLPLRTRLDGDPTFAELLARVRDGVFGAMDHADAPLDRVLEELRLPRSTSHTPLAQVLFFFQNHPAHALELAGLRVELADPRLVWPGTAQGDLTLFVNEHAERELTFELNTDLFEAETIERLAGNLLTLLAAAAEEPTTRVSELALITGREREELLRWNATGRELPRRRNIAALVAAQVERSPERVAVQLGERALTYRELDRRANALAHELRASGVGPGDLVGLYVERSLEMSIALLGTIKAGAAYLPLDPAFPADRLAYMLSTGAARAVVTQRALVASLPALPDSVENVVLANADAVLGPEAEAAPAGDAAPDDPAYVLFTSGSTGKPKGVEIRQAAAVNLLRSVAREPGMGSDDVICAVSTLSFDIALFELVLPLTVGARILLVDSDTARDGARLRQLVESAEITVMQATPATWRMLLEVGWRGKDGLKVITTGEACPRELADRLLGCGRELWNLYGPTETTVYSTLGRIEPGEGPVLVGRPVDNTEIHIVDRRFHLLPPGVPGELLIGGEGLAIGYRGRPDLTAEKFIPDPFSKQPGGRLYRTGDLARWRRDGTLEVLGRIDHQVKLRGFRIELGEIEAVLAEHPAVTQAVVHCREDRPGDKRLVAYCTTTDELPTVRELREHLKASLPDYMVPAAFVVLERFPLTPNGKVDRRSLPAPDEAAGDGETVQVAPRTPEEEILVELWSQLLQRGRVDVRDDFFDLGGHSLLATRLLSRIEQAFGVQLPLRTLFEAPTLEALAARVAAERARLETENLEELEELLHSLEGLSDEEASARSTAARLASPGETP